MPTYQNDPIISRLNTENQDFSGGVYGESTLFNGVRGVTYAAGHGAVVGVSENHTSGAGPGVFGQSDATGVWGQSKTWMGVYGKTESTTGGAGVMGEGVGPGVIGVSRTWHGVYGETNSTTGGAGVWGEHKSSGIGVVGKSNSGVGVWGVSETNEGVHAQTNSPNTAAVAAYQVNPQGTGAGVYAESRGLGPAGFFKGNVVVTGDLFLPGADCAEQFDISPGATGEAGTVMVIEDDATLAPCARAYDKKAAGVISGAGEFKPGIILDQQQSEGPRLPIALIGKVYCKVDADISPIEVGDMLTTSPTPGHAMKAEDPLKSFGAVIGKALGSLSTGTGLLPILVCLQ